MDIRSLVKHLEEQMAHKDAREPNCLWITNELKKYLEHKDIIGETILNQTTCQWCILPRKGRHAVHMESFGSFPVCEVCFDLYLKADYEQLKSRISQVHGDGGIGNPAK
ncbi:MAG: hypothetical protein PVI03_04205 [Candidatus Thorarchaeota archaeon]